MVDQDGVIIAHPNRELLYHSLRELSPEAVSTISSTIRFGTIKGTKKPFIPKNLGMDQLAARITSAQGPSTFRYSSPLDHRYHVIGYSSLKKHPWTVVVDLPEAQFLTPLNRMKTVAYISIGLVAVITMIISILLARSITRPIRHLTEISVDVKSDLPFNPSDIEDVTTGHDEIAHLGRVFSGMVLSLRESEEKYRELMENAVMGVYQVTKEGKFILVNQRMADIFGHASSQAFYRDVDNIAKLYAHPEERPKILKEIDDKGFVTGKEVRFRRKDEKSLWIRLNTRVTTNSDGVIIYEGLMEDITERKRTEKALQTSHNRPRKQLLKY